MNYRVVGIDPSSRTSAVCCAGRVTAISSGSLKAHLMALRNKAQAQRESLLVVWDSPLSFSRAVGYSARPIDLALSRLARAEPWIGKSAVNSLHFTGVTHWALTLDVLGIWIDSERQGPPWRDTSLQLVTHRTDLRRTAVNVAEIHPGGALAGWWLEKSSEKFEKYKTGPGVNAKLRLKRCEAIWEVVGRGEHPKFETTGLKPDDVLDAWAAWQLGCDWLEGNAEIVGSLERGGFLLPRGRLAEVVKGKLQEWDMTSTVVAER